jgi:hypothetical protein
VSCFATSFIPQSADCSTCADCVLSPTRFALLLYVPVFLAFGNMVELPIVIESKRVVFKQQGTKLYPALAYVVSVVLLHLPLAMLETAILGSFVYWLSGMDSR